MTVMKFRLPFKRLFHLHNFIETVLRLRGAVPNLGVDTFEKRWASWDEDRKRQFLRDIREVLEPYSELIKSKIEVVAEIGE